MNHPLGPRSGLSWLAALLLLLPAQLQAGLFPQDAATEPGTFVGIERAFPNLRFHRPVFLTGAGDGSQRIFVVEQAGLVRVFKSNGQPDQVKSSDVFLDIREQVSRRGNEEGLIGLAFHPEYAKNGQLYVHYSSSTEPLTNYLSRFVVDPAHPHQVDKATEQILLKVKQPYNNHNGGTIAFGTDGYLYISLGDGGAARDPHGHGQNLSTLLGSILRIDVNRRDDGLGYAIPEDNPFVDTPDARPEIWALGLRNVWRFSIDRKTGELWAADVGQDKFEEVSIIRRGGNYGWNRFEADHDFDTSTRMPVEPHAAPIAVYGREWGISITGGNVYRGQKFPELEGSYFYGDYVSGNLWRIRRAASGQYKNDLVRRTGRSIASFGEDDQGELFMLSFDGGIYRIVPSSEPENSLADWPVRLADTGLFDSENVQQPASHLIPYDVNAPFWSDDAEKTRFLALPAGSKLGYRSQGNWAVPAGTTIVKNFKRPGSFPSLLETRLIKKTTNGWQAATYVWNRNGKQAELVPNGKQFEIWTRSKQRGQPHQVDSWHAPSSSECASCHVEAAGYVLGLSTAQLNRDHSDGKNQILDWADQGLLDLPEGFDPATESRFVSPADAEADLEDRARVWLDVNCAMCHRPAGPGNANIDLRYATALNQTGMVNQPPAQGDLGIDQAGLVVPGAPERSLLLFRAETLGPGRMPNVGSNMVDQTGTRLLREWIQSLK